MDTEIEQWSAKDLDDNIDITKLFLIFRQRLGLFFAVFIMIFGITAVVSFQFVPLYTTTASVIIDPQGKELMDVESILMGAAPDSTLVDTEVQLIKSRSLVERVVKKLNLTEDPEFNSSLRELRGAALVLHNLEGFVTGLLPERTISDDTVELKERLEHEKVINVVLDYLSVKREGATFIINISFTSEVPWKAAKIANVVAEEYLIEQLEGKFETISRSNNWLDERLVGLREEVRAAEQAVEIYRAQSGLLNAGGTSLSEQQISNLNSQYLIQKAEYDGTLARLNSVKIQMELGAGAETIGEVLSSDVIRDLRKQQSEIAGRRAELVSRYGDLHPEVKRVERETIDVNSQIQQEVQRIVLSLEREVEIARQKVESINSGLSNLKRELTTNNKALVRLRELERDANATRALYENFLSRFKEANQQDTMAKADARVVSKASLPTKKSSPRTILNLLVGLLLGCSVGFGLVMLAEILDTGISTGAEIEDILRIPFIASIPLIEMTISKKLKKIVKKNSFNQNYIVKNPLSNYAENYRAIRSFILLSNIDKPPKVIAISSALPNEAKTVSSYSLGKISAMSGSRTLVVDCDLRRRGLTIMLDSKSQNGLVQVLNGESNYEEVVIKDDETGCDYLPVASSKFTPKDVFGSESFKHLLKNVREKYDLIILDTAPVLAVTETRTISNLADGVILAVKWRKTPVDAIRTATNLIRSSNGKLFGAFLTQVDFNTRRRYGYGDYSYYNKKYEGYYSQSHSE